MSRRDRNITQADKSTFDVAIIGGGINGASLFDLLCRRGYRVVLLDKGDFACGTSQASAMMIWGGLLYLRNFDLASVFSFSRARDHMIHDISDLISPCQFQFIPARKGLLSKLPILSAMYLYWVIGCFRRKRPCVKSCSSVISRQNANKDMLLFEEGMLHCSDCRFVLHLLTQKRFTQQLAINYCAVKSGGYDRRNNNWHIEAEDRIGRKKLEIRAAMVANCAGVWTDSVNQLFNIQSPFKHVFSKGVFISLQRSEEQKKPIVFAQEENNDVILNIPWGPVSLWGPTENTVTDIEEGFMVSPDDVRYLIRQYKRHMNTLLTKEDIVSLRCGIRPLAVDRAYARDSFPLDLSRRFKVATDYDVPWISVYGGKITGCNHAAAIVADKIAARLPPPPRDDTLSQEEPESFQSIPLATFPGLQQKIPAIEWCMKEEFCCTLGDYLRRRTEIAQWTAREGLGHNNENKEALRALCLSLAKGDEKKGEVLLEEYSQQVKNGFDRVLAEI